MDEKALTKKAKSGDRESFAELYTLYRDRLYRYAVFKVGDQLAADAVSECITRAWSSIGSLRDSSAFQGWIFRILYRVCADQIREQIARREISNIDDAVIPYSEGFEHLELAEALSLLSAEERDIVLLSAVSGFNSREIGKLLGATVRSKLSRSLKKMREFLE